MDEEREIDSPGQYEALAPETKSRLQEWIKARFLPPTSPRHKTRGSSYSIKHDYEDDSREYVTNGQFKGAMQAAGFEPVDATYKNWTFKAIYRKERKRLPAPTA